MTRIAENEFRAQVVKRPSSEVGSPDNYLSPADQPEFLYHGRVAHPQARS
jgi:hypothetical protein